MWLGDHLPPEKDDDDSENSGATNPELRGRRSEDDGLTGLYSYASATAASTTTVTPALS